MLRNFTLEYWRDGGWYVGRLKEVPGVFSQGVNIQELEANIQDAYRVVLADGNEGIASTTDVRTKEIGVEY